MQPVWNAQHFAVVWIRSIVLSLIVPLEVDPGALFLSTYLSGFGSTRDIPTCWLQAL